MVNSLYKMLEDNFYMVNSLYKMLENNFYNEDYVFSVQDTPNYSSYNIYIRHKNPLNKNLYLGQLQISFAAVYNMNQKTNSVLGKELVKTIKIIKNIIENLKKHTLYIVMENGRVKTIKTKETLKPEDVCYQWSGNYTYER